MKILCRIFGHTNPVCPNGCTKHGFCTRCGYYSQDKGKTWYKTWQEAS